MIPHNQASAFIMENTSDGIEYLQNPLVLIGFVIFLFVGLFKLIRSDKITGRASAALFNKALNYLFVLALLIVLAGFGLNFYQSYKEQPSFIPSSNNNANENPSNDETATPTATQPSNITEISTQGEQSPAINSGSDVNINYGDTLSDKNTNPNNEAKTAAPAKLETQGEQSPAINSGGDVNINYGD